ncbi:hypothetical protein [Streptomyces sp. NPDC005438]|uniref:hypothetical protein n=1 Tax=Streptomyces sp. NPDC005438 TaxID=3156880 RepID=UPI0033BF20C2
MLGGVGEAPERHIYLLVTSHLPDPYINVLTYLFDSGTRAASINLVKIRQNGGGDSARMDEEIHLIHTSIVERLRDLASGKYPRTVDGSVRYHEIGAEAAETYEKCLNWLLRTETRIITVDRGELDGELRSFIATGGALFDVTTLKKDLLVDVTALLLSQGCGEFYYFDLGKAPEHFDDRELYHSLEGFRDYRMMSSSEHVKTAMARMVARSLTHRRLLVYSLLVFALVCVAQFFFTDTWVVNVVASIATAASIVSVLFLLSRDT